jgi:DNA polymerase I
VQNLILFDGDYFLYKACFAAQREIYFPNDAPDEDEYSSIDSIFGEVLEVWNAEVENAKAVCDTDEMIVAFSDNHDNFRKRLDPEYKANRKKNRRPNHYQKLRKYAIETYNAKIIPSLEGDDVLGIMATSNKFKADYRKIIVSIDKDMKTVPGFFFDVGKPENEVREVTSDEAHYWHLYQTLTGDTTDHYKGCPSFGEKTTEKWFEKHGVSWQSVVNAYKSKGLTEDDALLQARLAFILHAPYYKVKRKEVVLWTPKEKVHAELP